MAPKKQTRSIKVFDIHEVQERLEELIEELKPGESFLISVNGKPKAEVIALLKEEIARLMKKERE